MSAREFSLMNVAYREIQYYPRPFYLTVLGSSAVCTSVAVGRLLAAGMTGVVALFAVLGLLLLALVAVLGRLVVTVDGERMTISRGWLGLLQKRFDVDKISEVRVRILNPLLTYTGWGSKNASCYTVGVRRGVELGVGDHRVVIGSANPQMLKDALLPGEVAADDRPEYRQANLKMARRRRIPVHQNWGILDPQKMRAMSA